MPRSVLSYPSCAPFSIWASDPSVARPSAARLWSDVPRGPEQGFCLGSACGRAWQCQCLLKHTGGGRPCTTSSNAWATSTIFIQHRRLSMGASSKKGHKGLLPLLDRHRGTISILMQSDRCSYHLGPGTHPRTNDFNWPQGGARKLNVSSFFFFFNAWQCSLFQ